MNEDALPRVVHRLMPCEQAAGPRRSSYKHAIIEPWLEWDPRNATEYSTFHFRLQRKEFNHEKGKIVSHTSILRSLSGQFRPSESGNERDTVSLLICYLVSNTSSILTIILRKTQEGGRLDHIHNTTKALFIASPSLYSPLIK